MTKLVIKSKYNNSIITKSHPKLGTIRLTVNEIEESEFNKYVEMGFEMIFEEVCTKCELVKCKCKKEKTPKMAKNDDSKVVEYTGVVQNTQPKEEDIKPTPKKKRKYTKKGDK